MSATWSTDEQLRVLRDALTRTLIDDEFSFVSLEAEQEDAKVCFRWMQNPHVFAMRFPFDPARSEMTGEPIASQGDWVDDVTLTLMEELGTGFVLRATRTRVGDHIELAEPSWPTDERFHINDIDPSPSLSNLHRDGLDTSTPSRLREERFIGWVTSHVNSMSSHLCVGQAVVCWADETTASLEFLEVRPGAPATVAFDLARAAAHEAADAGAERVVTTLKIPESALIGFRVDEDGVYVVDCAFLGQDRAAAASFLRRVESETPEWNVKHPSRAYLAVRNRVARLLGPKWFTRLGRKGRTTYWVGPGP